MGQLTSTMFKVIGNFRQDIIDALQADLNATSNPEAVTSGALSLTKAISELSVTGTVAFTLAAPTATGQRKTIRCVAAASTPIGTLTITSPDTTTGYVCQAAFVFDTPGQELVLEATPGLLWRCIAKRRAGGTANNVVVGTTVLTGYSMWEIYALSVTGTVSSTTTKALPNGSSVGERCVIGVSTAASTPNGSVDFVGRTIIAGAVTHLTALDATADTAVLVWDGQTWQVEYSTGITIN